MDFTSVGREAVAVGIPIVTNGCAGAVFADREGVRSTRRADLTAHSAVVLVIVKWSATRRAKGPVGGTFTLSGDAACRRRTNSVARTTMGRIAFDHHALRATRHGVAWAVAHTVYARGPGWTNVSTRAAVDILRFQVDTERSANVFSRRAFAHSLYTFTAERAGRSTHAARAFTGHQIGADAVAVGFSSGAFTNAHVTQPTERTFDKAVAAVIVVGENVNAVSLADFVTLTRSTLARISRVARGIVIYQPVAVLVCAVTCFRRAA